MKRDAIAIADVDEAYRRAITNGASAAGIPILDEHWDGTPPGVLMAGEHSEPTRMAFLLGPDGELIEIDQSHSSH